MSFVVAFNFSFSTNEIRLGSGSCSGRSINFFLNKLRWNKQIGAFFMALAFACFKLFGLSLAGVVWLFCGHPKRGTKRKTINFTGPRPMGEGESFLYFWRKMLQTMERMRFLGTTKWEFLYFFRSRHRMGGTRTGVRLEKNEEEFFFWLSGSVRFPKQHKSYFAISRDSWNFFTCV